MYQKKSYVDALRKYVWNPNSKTLKIKNQENFYIKEKEQLWNDFEKFWILIKICNNLHKKFRLYHLDSAVFWWNNQTNVNSCFQLTKPCVSFKILRQNYQVLCSNNCPKTKSQKKLSPISLMFPNDEKKDQWKKSKVICMKTLANRMLVN